MAQLTVNVIELSHDMIDHLSYSSNIAIIVNDYTCTVPVQNLYRSLVTSSDLEYFSRLNYEGCFFFSEICERDRDLLRGCGSLGPDVDHG